METLEPDHLRRAQTCLQNAITRDPASGLAHSGLGHCYSLMGLQRVLAKEEAQRLSEASTQRALALDPGLGEGHATLAFLKCWYAMNWPEAERDFRRALDLAPENARIQRDFGTCLALLGRWPESLQHLKEAVARDPLSQASRTSYAVYLHWAGRSEESLEEFAKAIDQDPTSRNTLSNYLEVLEQLGRIEEALQVSDRLGNLAVIPERDAAALRTAFETRDLKGYRAERVRQAEVQPDADPVRLAELVSLQGDRDRAFRLLGRALREKSLGCARIPNSPALVLVRADPRFRQLLLRMGYPES